MGECLTDVSKVPSTSIQLVRLPLLTFAAIHKTLHFPALLFSFDCFTLKMEAVASFEMMLTTDIKTQCRILENWSFQIRSLLEKLSIGYSVVKSKVG